MRDEHTKALKLANMLLDCTWRDPDDDLSTLARQLIRTSERVGSTMVVLVNVLDALWDSGAIFADDSNVGIAVGKAWTFLGEKPMRPRPAPLSGILKCRDPNCSIKGNHDLTDDCDQMK